MSRSKSVGPAPAVNAPSPVLVVCGWCGVVIKLGQLPTSHGICSTCAQAFQAEYDAPGQGLG